MWRHCGNRGIAANRSLKSLVAGISAGILLHTVRRAMPNSPEVSHSRGFGHDWSRETSSELLGPLQRIRTLKAGCALASVIAAPACPWTIAHSAFPDASIGVPGELNQSRPIPARLKNCSAAIFRLRLKGNRNPIGQRRRNRRRGEGTNLARVWGPATFGISFVSKEGHACRATCGGPPQDGRAHVRLWLTRVPSDRSSAWNGPDQGAR